MRRIIKPTDSKIRKAKLVYKVHGNNSKIKEILLDEQNNICAYTEEYLSRTDKAEIDHFNPLLKGEKTDNYENWFLVKAQWNLEKSKKWGRFQPVMHPTDQNFEERIIYSEGDYFIAIDDDVEAKHLYNLIKLGDEKLAQIRKSYIQRMRKDMDNAGQNPQDFFDELIADLPNMSILSELSKQNFK